MLPPHPRILTVALLALGLLCASSQAQEQAAPKRAHPLEPLKVFLGKWAGEVEGNPGQGSVERTYAFALGERFIEIRNRSTYPPQEKNPKGEVHEDIGYLSYDRGAKAFALRQFHVEGFVNQFLSVPHEGEGVAFRFVTTAIENIPPGWRARETYTFAGENEFTEVFELAAPDAEFEVYSTTRFNRVADLRERSGAVRRMPGSPADLRKLKAATAVLNISH